MRLAEDGCAACEAVDAIVEAHAIADSLDAAERHARLWLELPPTSPAAHRRLVEVLDAGGRFAEATSLLGGGFAFGTAQDS